MVRSCFVCRFRMAAFCLCSAAVRWRVFSACHTTANVDAQAITRRSAAIPSTMRLLRPRDRVDEGLVRHPYVQAFDDDRLRSWRGDDVAPTYGDGVGDVGELTGGYVPFPAEAGVGEVDLSGFVSSLY